MSVAHSARESIDQVLDEVTAVRDQARLQTHLLSLDARSRLERLEATLRGFESRLRDGEGPLETAIASAVELSNAVRTLISQEAPKSLATPVNQFMSRGVRTCRETASLSEAAGIMWEADCGFVPVLGETDSVVGVITDRDICMGVYTHGQNISNIPVSAVMARSVVWIDPEAPAQRAVELMHSHRVRRLPVLSNASGLVGVISLADLVTLKDPCPGWLIKTLAEISRSRPRS